MRLEELFAASPGKIRTMVDNLKLRAAELGLEFGPRTMTYNSRLAQELGLWADDCGCGAAFHRVAFRTYFVDGKNLASLPVLISMAKQVGLSPEEAETVVVSRSHAERVDLDWEQSRQLGITAIPTIVIGQHKLVGAQDYRTLVDLVLSFGAKRRL